MKFIRDIIAEKTSMLEADRHQASGGETADPVNRNGAGTLPEDLDPVHKVACGGASLSKANHSAFRADGELEEGQDVDNPPEEAKLQDTRGSDAEIADDDGYDPSDLFANIWDEDPQVGTHAGDAPEATTETSDEAEPANPVPETNSQALMRTMYPGGLASSGDKVLPPQTDAEEYEAQESQTEEKAELPAEENGASHFQKVLRRQQTEPPEPEATPAPEPSHEDALPTEAPISVPAPAAGRARRQAGRVKTRLLGFGNDFAGEKDLFASGSTSDPTGQSMYPVGWIVIVSGPGRGTAFTLFNGVSQIGRGDDQAVRLDFGDNSISRTNHAAVAYDPEQQGFFLGHGGKANLVRLNGNPVLSTEPLHNGASIRIGETTLRFISLCGAEFDWGKTQEGEGSNG